MAELYRRAPRHELCACGLVIIAGPFQDAVLYAVRAHQQEKQHRDWFAASGWGR